MGFSSDNNFSIHKDNILKKYMNIKNSSALIMATKSMLLQKECGFDLIVQKKGEEEQTIDTKHVIGIYDKFFLEEESCPAIKKPGWLLREGVHPHLFFYCFWTSCNKECKDKCNICNKKINVTCYVLDTKLLIQWFKQNKDKYYLHFNNTINGTSGRLVNIKDIPKNIRLVKFEKENLTLNKEIVTPKTKKQKIKKIKTDKITSIMPGFNLFDFGISEQLELREVA